METTIVTPTGTPLLRPLPEEALPVTTTTQLTKVEGPPSPPPSWLHTNLRNIIALTATVAIVYLAYEGIEQARTNLIAAFTLLVGAIWGERAALKTPGKDT